MNYLRILFFISRCFCLFLLQYYNIKIKCKLVYDFIFLNGFFKAL